MVKACQKGRRNRNRAYDRPEIRAILIQCHQERISGKNPAATSLEACTRRVKRDTGIQISRAHVRRGLIDHDLYGPWERKTKK